MVGRGLLSVATLVLFVGTARTDPWSGTVVGSSNLPSARDETPVGMTTDSGTDAIEILEHLTIPSGWWKGNTHTHSDRSDGNSPPDQVAAHYESLDYDFLVLSDHNQATPFSIYSTPGYLCIDGEEITHSTNHTNGLGLASAIPAGSIQQNVDAVLGQGGLPHLNHPTYSYLTVDDIYPVVGLRHMEIYNALTDDNEEASWDALLTMGKPLYGVASDDSHTLGLQSGHAWIVVRAAVLARNEILAAMDNGDYYASTGIVLNDYSADDARVVVDTQNGDLIEFVGANGQVLHSVPGAYAEYRFTGSETYVRARITNTGSQHGWTQPHYPSWALDDDAHADAVLGHQNLGTGSPLAALGPIYEGKVPANWSDFSVRIDSGGILLLDMGEGEEIIDRDGYDLYIEEVDAEDGVEDDDPYQVHVSEDAVNWTYIGDGSGDSYFDLGGVVSAARYLKIEATQLPAEIDGVEANVIDRYADRVVDSSGISAGLPRYALGAPYPYAIGDPSEDHSCRIDPGGFLVLDLGAGEEKAVDGPGADVYVEEVDTEDGVGTDDPYTLSGSLDLVDWVQIGQGNGDEYFDLGGLMPAVRYLRIEPIGTSVDIDGVRVENRAADSPIFSDGFESGDPSAWSATVGSYAGHLQVMASAASVGSYGLQVTVGGTCSAANDLVITAPPLIEGTFLACNSITAGGVQVGSSGATFAAGRRITLGDNFSVASGSSFAAALDPGLLNGSAHVEWESASRLDGYSASFHLRLDGLSLAPGDLIELFNGYSDNGEVQIKVILKYNPTLMENRLVLSVRQDDGSYVNTPQGNETLLPAGWNEIEVDWQAGAGTGSLTVSVNGAPDVGLTGVDNDEQRVDEVSLGYVGGSITTTSGSMDLDEFTSFR